MAPRGPIEAGAGRILKLLACSVAYIAVSYAQFLAPERAVNLSSMMIFWSFFCTTAIILCDEGTGLLQGRSLMARITSSPRAFRTFVIAGSVSGLLLDGVCQWLGKLWIYPYWTTTLYAATFVLGFCAYWLLLAETYLLALGLARRFTAPRQPAAAPRAAMGTAITGAALSLTGLVLAFSNGEFQFEIHTPSSAASPFACFPLIFGGVWLLLEYTQHRRRRQSLLSASFSGDWAPFCALLISAWGFGSFMESVNVAHHFWRYTNWPFESIRFAGVPALVILLWPLQHIVFLSLYQTLSNGRCIWT